MPRILFIIFIIICANKFFHLAPWLHIHGVFNVWDIGSGLLIIALAFTLLKYKNVGELNNPISVLIIVLFLILGVQIALASIFYGQSILSGIIGIRHMSYYLLFFLALLLLKTTEECAKTLNILSLIAILLFIAGIINYIHPGLFYHMWVEGHGTRSGIKRAFIPGMDIISLALLWEFSKWTVRNDMGRRTNAVSSTTLLAAHFFRQTRSRILAIVFIMALMFGWKRGWKLGRNLILVMFVALAVTYGITQINTGDSLLLSPVSTTVKDISEGEGTWSPRLKCLDTDLEEFLKHPIIGSGLAALRIKPEEVSIRKWAILEKISSQSDMGYSHWLKTFGIVGIIWLILFFYYFGSIAKNAIQESTGTDQMIALLGSSYLGYMMISYITLNHLMFPFRIVIFTLVSAMLVRIIWNRRHRHTTTDPST